MTSDQPAVRAQRHNKRLIALTVPGESEPELHEVSADVYTIVAKLLAANRLSISVGRAPQFIFGELRFLLTMLGAPSGPERKADELPPFDLWVSGE